MWCQYTRKVVEMKLEIIDLHVSLTSVVCKVMESILRHEVLTYMST